MSWVTGAEGKAGAEDWTRPSSVMALFAHLVKLRIAGVGGIVISGVLAAAMSSVDSSLNAVSSVVVVDVIQRSLFQNRTDKVSPCC